MEYPEDFIERVKEEYPYTQDWEELHTALDHRDDYTIGRYLEDNSRLEMNAEEIVAAFDKGEQEKVKEAAEKVVHRKKLYKEWSKLCEKQL